MGSDVSPSALYGCSRRGGRAFGRAPRNWGKNVTLLASMTCRGVGPCPAVEGATRREVFVAYLERVLAPTLVPGQVVVMDDLSAHKGGRVEQILGEAGCGPRCTCRPTLRTSTPSSRPSPRSRARCAKSRGAHPRGASGSDVPGAGRADGERRPGVLRPLRLPNGGPTALTNALQQ